MIWQLLGMATVAGLGVMVLLLPVNVICIGLEKKYQVQSYRIYMAI